MLRITIVLYLAKMSGPTHNLNIQEYSLSELLGLFELNSYDISVEDLKVPPTKNSLFLKADTNL